MVGCHVKHILRRNYCSMLCVYLVRVTFDVRASSTLCDLCDLFTRTRMMSGYLLVLAVLTASKHILHSSIMLFVSSFSATTSSSGYQRLLPPAACAHITILVSCNRSVCERKIQSTAVLPPWVLVLQVQQHYSNIYCIRNNRVSVKCPYHTYSRKKG